MQVEHPRRLRDERSQRDAAGRQVRPDRAVTIPDVTAEPATDVGATSATLHGVVNPDGIDTTDCLFQYGIDANYNLTAPCEIGGVPTSVISGSSDVSVSAPVSGLAKGSTYHYKLTAKNANEVLSQSNDDRLHRFRRAERSATSSPARSTPTRPSSTPMSIPPVAPPTTTSNGGRKPASTTTRSRFPTAASPPTPRRSGSASSPGASRAGTTYHYRVIAHNDAGSSTGGDNEFTTFAPPPPDDVLRERPRPPADGRRLPARLPCLRAGLGRRHRRLQRRVGPGARPDPVRRLPAGRARGSSTGSTTARSLVPGTRPIAASTPTSRPVVRTAGRPNTSGSPPTSRGDRRPVRVAAGGSRPGLEQLRVRRRRHLRPVFRGRLGQRAAADAGRRADQGDGGLARPRSAGPAGRIVKRFSADGSHFLFGSTAKFESDANSNGTDVDDLRPRPRHRHDPGRLEAAERDHDRQRRSGVAELDISDDGSRIVIGRLVSTDAKGNQYYHLYMHVGSSPTTIDLTPGSTSGALYDGMTERRQHASTSRPATRSRRPPTRTPTPAPTSTAPTSARRARR